MPPLGVSFFGNYNPPRDGFGQTLIVAGTMIRRAVIDRSPV
ncbi:MAG TPA: hypothetical protein VGM98_18735 [Schlesneria sp.]